MAQIHDRGDTWELSIFPEITESAEIIDEPAKGYRAMLGYDPQAGTHVVANVMYSKDMYSIQDVMNKIESLRTCERCDTLDKERLKLESINVPNRMPQQTFSPPATMQHRQIVAEPHIPIPVPQNIPLSQQVGPNVKDLFANVIMDAYLTDPGKFFLGMMLDDNTLMESAYPDDKADMGKFMGDMIDFMSGDMDFMRSPQDAREFLLVMRSDADAKTRAGGTSSHRRLLSSSDSIVIH